jgi:hypothetical protein
MQSLFFRVTAKLTPKTPAGAFTPPEREQQNESALETVARRAVEKLAQRGPLDAADKQRAAQVVHYGFGAAWGGLYGLLRASYPRLWSPAGIAELSLGVWMVGDNVILPAFKLAAWPHRYPLRSHAYALAAHLAYGAGVAATLEVIDHAELVPLVAALALVRGRAAGERAIELAARSRALVPRDVIESSRHFAEAIARRARDLTR